jgi:hypothetical protein
MAPRAALSPEQRRAVARRQTLIRSEEYGPAYLRLSAADRSRVDALLESGDSRGARRETLRLDELRRLRRRGVGISLDGVQIDRSLTPLGGRVPIRDHEPRSGYSFFLFDYQCIVTVREFDGHTYKVFTSNLGFDHWPTKQQIAEFGIEDIRDRLDGTYEGSDRLPQGTVVRIALVTSRRRA